jgi:hypothetical protein
VSAAYEITCIVEFVIEFFSKQNSPCFVGAGQLRRANLVGNDMPSVVTCNDLGNEIMLQHTELYKPQLIILHLRCICMLWSAY